MIYLKNSFLQKKLKSNDTEMFTFMWENYAIKPIVDYCWQCKLACGQNRAQVKLPCG